jgi:hypothetical protein
MKIGTYTIKESDFIAALEQGGVKIDRADNRPNPDGTMPLTPRPPYAVALAGTNLDGNGNVQVTLHIGTGVVESYFSETVTPATTPETADQPNA